jgi:hypothetical protein
MAITARDYDSYQDDAWKYWHSTGSNSGTSTTNHTVSYDTQNSIWSQWTTTSVQISNSTNSYSASELDKELIWINWQEQSKVSGTADSYTITVDDQDVVWMNWHNEKVVYIGDSTTAVEKTRKERLKQKREEIRAKKMAEKKRRRRMFKDELNRREAVAAESKAMELLEDLIGDDQMKVYKETGRILVHGDNYDWLISNYSDQTSKDMKTRNYFELTRNVKIQRVEKDKIVDLCVAHRLDHEQKRIPVSDQVIGFLLHAKCDEDNLKKTANNMGTRNRILPKKYAIAN